MGIPNLDTIDIVAPRHLIQSLDGAGIEFGIFRHAGNPNGFVEAYVGSICVDTDGSLWQKKSGGFSNSGWVEFATGVDRTYLDNDLTAVNDRTHNWGANDLTNNNLADVLWNASGTQTFEANEFIVTAVQGITVDSGNPSVAASITLKEASNNGSGTVAVAAPLDVETSYSFRLPVKPGLPGEVLTTDGTGITSWTTQTTANITQGTLLPATDPRFVDFNNQTLTMTNASTQTYVATGDIAFQAGAVRMQTAFAEIIDNINATEGGKIRFREGLGVGINYVTVQAAGAMAQNWTLTLPDAKPTANDQYLVSDINGNTQWVSLNINDDYRGAWADITALNDAVEGNLPPFDTQPAQLGNYAALLNGVEDASWAVYDDSAPPNRPFVEIDPADPVVNLGVGTRDGFTFEITNTAGTNVVLLEATQTLAGLMLATDKVKLDNIDSWTQQYGDGANVSYAILHSLGTKNVQVIVRETAGSGSDERIVYPRVEFNNDNQLTIYHAVAPNVNQYTVHIQKV